MLHNLARGLACVSGLGLLAGGLHADPVAPAEQKPVAAQGAAPTNTARLGTVMAIGKGNTASNEAGVIGGETTIDASRATTSAVAIGEGNTAKNTSGAIKGATPSKPAGVQIQGNTIIKATTKNATAVSVGKEDPPKKSPGGSRGGTIVAVGMERDSSGRPDEDRP